MRVLQTSKYTIHVFVLRLCKPCDVILIEVKRPWPSSWSLAEVYMYWITYRSNRVHPKENIFYNNSHMISNVWYILCIFFAISGAGKDVHRSTSSAVALPEDVPQYGKIPRTIGMALGVSTMKHQYNIRERRSVNTHYRCWVQWLRGHMTLPLLNWT